MKRIAVMTSGGDCSGMNAAVRAVVRTGIEYGVEVWGVRQGYLGLLNGDIQKLTSFEVSGILQRGGTILRTARTDEFKTPAGQSKGLRQLNQRDIEGMIVVGGDGSLRGAMALHKLNFPVIGVPASIDNDIDGTNMSIGVDTALNTILDNLDRIRDTADSHNRAFVIEVMGRNCGYLGLISSILGGAEIVSIPEYERTKEEIATALKESFERGKTHAVVVVAEGVSNKATALVEYLKQREKEIGFEVRLTILGHTQRGGKPSAFDRLLATRMGLFALEKLREGESGKMVALTGRDLELIPIETAIARTRPVNPKYIDLARILTR